ncbi:MAG: alpha/beta hydrolase [Candidatus Nitrosopolaris sp.]
MGWVVMPVFIAFAFLLIIPSTAILISNNSYFGTSNLAYGQPAQMNSNVTNSLNIQNIPVKKIHVGDIDIAYKTFGKGEPFLLISGAGMNMDAWEPSTLKSLSTNHTVVIFDNRGVGNTTTGTKPFSVQQFANDTAGLIDALNIQIADVLGFSQGSFTAQQLIVTHPEKVKRLILYAASCGGKESISPSPEFLKSSKDFINNLTRGITTPPPGFTLNTAMQQNKVGISWLTTNWSGICEQLRSISKPTLVIAGTDDVVPVANSLVIAAKIPGAWLVQIKGAGHDLMFHYPDKFNKVLQAFLSTTTG